MLVATGSRAEFGLLLPVMRAVREHGTLELVTVAAGSHFLTPAETWRDIEAAGFRLDARVEMQREGETGRLADARALGRGIEGFARVFEEWRPEWVVVLGDRIEALAAAASASVGGLRVAHLHAGDRAEGIADEGMRHAASRLSHLLLAATPESARRLVRMGEDEWRVRVVGSPAIDGLERVEALDDAAYAELGSPSAAVLLHPSGLSEEDERGVARAVLEGLGDRRALVLAPNADAGREWVLDELERGARAKGWRLVHHLARDRFVGLLKRLAIDPGGVIVGNSSAALVECAALRLPAVNIGPRQGGRECPDNVVQCERSDARGVREAVSRALSIDRRSLSHPYGDGRTGERVSALLAEIDAGDPAWLRKRCTY